MLPLQVFAALASGFAPLHTAASFEWQANYEEALVQAADEKKVVFVAVDFVVVVAFVVVVVVVFIVVVVFVVVVMNSRP